MHSWRDLEGFYMEAAIGTLGQAEFEKLQTRPTAEFEAGVLTSVRTRELKRFAASIYLTVISDAISLLTCTQRFPEKATTGPHNLKTERHYRRSTGARRFYCKP
jgi:hypothetical protein